MDITATQAAKTFGSLLECARLEPVTITYRGEPDFVIISARHFSDGQAVILESYAAEAELYRDHLAEISRGLIVGR